MAVIGALGGTVFHVSSNTVKTFTDMSWDSDTKYAQHDRHILGSIMEFTGNSPDTISFDMFFSVFLGINPEAEINSLKLHQRLGLAMTLVLGSKRYGTRWVITNLKFKLQHHDNRGNLLVASVKVSLKAYSTGVFL